MFDFMNNFFNTTVVTLRNALTLLVIALAVYMGVTKKSLVAFATTALAGGLALWIASPAGLGLFPGLFQRAAEQSACAQDANGNLIGAFYRSNDGKVFDHPNTEASGKDPEDVKVTRGGTDNPNYNSWRCHPRSTTVATPTTTTT